MRPGWLLFETPLGACGLAWDAAGQLRGARLPEADTAATRARMARCFGEGGESRPPTLVATWVARQQAVWAGAVDLLDDIPLALDGTPAFHRRVYALTRQIPPGQVRRYGELAEALGEPGAARAVGQALGRNPFAPIVPCHRVMAARGAAGGFSAPGGLATKLRLLQLEGAALAADARQTPLF